MSTDPIVHLLSGSGGGMLSQTLTYPLYTVVVKVMATRAQQKKNNFSASESQLDPVSKQKGTVMRSEDGAAYDVMLTKTADESKQLFYKLQALRTERGPRLWTRWGTVGEVGMYQLVHELSEEATIKSFHRVFRDQTGLQWSSRGSNARHSRYAVARKLESGELVAENPNSKSMWTHLRDIVAQDGWLALYQGLPSCLVAVAVQMGAYYYFFRLFRNLHKVSPTNATGNLIAGGEAGVATVLSTNWLWVINSRQMTDKGKRGWFETLRSICSTEGVAGLWSGAIPAVVLASNPAIHFFTVALISKWARSLKSGKTDTPLEVFVQGALSKMSATLATYPIQTVKICLQRTAQAGTRQYSGVYDCVSDILSREGPLAFYNGMQTKLLQTTLTAAFLFVFRSQLEKIFSRILRSKK